MKRETKSLRKKFDPLQVKFHPLSSYDAAKHALNSSPSSPSSFLHSSNSQNPFHKSPSYLLSLSQPNSISLNHVF